MGAMLGGAIGAIHGGTTARIEDADTERRDRQYAIDTLRYSPWTGMSAGAIREAPSSRQAAYQGFMSGMGAGQGLGGGGMGGAQGTQMAPGGWAGMNVSPYQYQQNPYAQKPPTMVG